MLLYFERRHINIGRQYHSYESDLTCVVTPSQKARKGSARCLAKACQKYFLIGDYGYSPVGCVPRAGFIVRTPTSYVVICTKAFVDTSSLMQIQSTE